MFHSARNFTVTAAEINDVQGSLRRDRSPTVVNFHNVPFRVGAHGVNQSAVNPFVPNSPAAPAGTRDAGMFSYASNFGLVGAEVNSVQGDMVRTMSRTEMTVSFAQSDQSPRTHRAYLHPNAHHVLV